MTVAVVRRGDAAYSPHVLEQFGEWCGYFPHGLPWITDDLLGSRRSSR
jgi:hypothetical protein